MGTYELQAVLRRAQESIAAACTLIDRDPEAAIDDLAAARLLISTALLALASASARVPPSSDRGPDRELTKDAEFGLSSGHVTGRLDIDGTALVLVCQRHVSEQAIPRHWPNADFLIRDFLDRHAACLADSRYGATRSVANSSR